MNKMVMIDEKYREGMAIPARKFKGMRRYCKRAYGEQRAGGEKRGEWRKRMNYFHII